MTNKPKRKRIFGTLNTDILTISPPRGVRFGPSQTPVAFRIRIPLSELPPPAERPPRQ
jgi:hypothetical protein